MADETENTFASSAPKASGSSVMKLLGIAIGLTAVAALAVGIIFWQTYTENSGKEAALIPVGDQDTSMDDESYEAQGEGDPTGGGGAPGSGGGGVPGEDSESDSPAPSDEADDSTGEDGEPDPESDEDTGADDGDGDSQERSLSGKEAPIPRPY